MPTSVFISSTSRDLAEHRAAVQRSLLDAGLHPVGMESFGALPVEPTRACLEELRAVDLFVGIYAWRYGFIPEGSSASISEQELDEARRLGKPCFCFLVDESWPWPDDFREKGSGAGRLHVLKSRIDRELTRATFTSPENLAARVLASLQRWERQHRHGTARPEEDLRGRRILLDRVRSFWIEGLLERATEDMPLQDLPKEVDTEAVAQPWHGVLGTPGPLRRPLPAHRSAFELFEDSGRALLLLGAPGSGKTITLLELAREAAKQADQNSSQPIPVVFNLSSWGGRQARLVDWLTEELATKYQIPRKIGRRWIEADDLLLILDGLDEVPEARRGACVESINKFREEQGFTGLAVGCRLGDYEALRVKLVLGASVALRPLEPEQVEAAMAGHDSGLGTLKKALVEDPDLRELAQSPLLLTIMRRAYSDISEEDLLDPRLTAPAARRRHLFSAYINRMLSRRGGSLPYSRDRILSWLSWLARGMDRAHCSVFLLEELQPGWLGKRRDLIAYSVFSFLIPGLLISAPLALLQFAPLAAGAITVFPLIGIMDGAAQSLLWSRDANLWRFRITRALLVSAVILVSLLFWVDGTFLPAYLPMASILGIWAAASGLQRNPWDAWSRIRPLETLVWSWRQMLRRTVFLFFPLGPLLVILYVAVPVILGESYIVNKLGLGEGYVISYSSPALLTLSPLLLALLLSGFTGKPRRDKSYPNQGIWLSGRHGVLFGVVGVLLFLLLLLAPFRSAPLLILCGSFSCLAGLCIGLLNGGLDFLMHFLLRLSLSWRRSFPFRATPFLDFAADRVLLYKVGGGYVFAHRLLLEHFASLGPEPPR